jgi:hypothetical protein
MVDDKDDSAADPWAGIEEEGGGQAADGFSFSFDASSEVDDNPFAPPLQEPAATAPEHDAADASIFPIDTTLEGEAAPDSEADPFASLSIDAADAADGADEIAGWLSEPAEDAGGEQPLAVFPAGDVEPLEEPPLAAEAFPETPVAFESGVDDLHAFAEPEETAVGGSSQVEVGTGFSGIVSPSEVDPASDALPGDDWPDAAAMDTTLDDFATDDQPSFDASGFDGVSEVGEAQPDQEGHELAAAGAVAATAAVAAATAARGRPAARKKGGGLGQLVGIVLGGLMAIPITYAILIWGFQKDPFKLAALVPEQVAFLLPQKFQPGFKAQGAARLDAASALDDLPETIDTTAAVEPAAEEPSAAAAAAVAADDVPAKPSPDALAGDLATPTDPDAPADAPGAAGRPMPVPSPAAAFDDIVADTPPKTPPEPAAPPEPEPLDLSALEAAVGEAAAAFETLAAADVEAPDRKKLLVGWYKRLAAVAEQLVLLEKIAADSGRDLDEASAVIDAVCGPIAMDAGLQDDLTKLSGSWLTSKKRTADGAMLLATFESARQVGPYWAARVTIDGVEPQSVAVISRAEPRVDPGTRVLVSGVLFDGDVVWASDVRSLEKKAAPAEDLF